MSGKLVHAESTDLCVSAMTVWDDMLVSGHYSGVIKFWMTRDQIPFADMTLFNNTFYKNNPINNKNKNNQQIHCINSFKGHSRGISAIMVWRNPITSTEIDERTVEEPSLLLTGSQNGCIRVWNKHGQSLCELRDAHNSMIEVIGSYPATEWILSAGFDSTIQIWKIVKAKTVASNNTLTNSTGSVVSLGTQAVDLQPIKNTTDYRAACMCSLINTILVTGCMSEKQFRLWDRDFTIPTKHGQHVVTALCDVSHTVHNYDAKIHSNLPLENSEQEIVLNSQHSYLAVANSDKNIRIWTIHRFAHHVASCIQILKGHEASIKCLCVWRSKLCSVSNDKTIRIWSWQAGICIAVLRGHTDVITGLCVWNNALFSSSLDCSIKGWKVELPWHIIRILWIGWKKNSWQECLVAALPKEILQYIILLLNDTAFDDTQLTEWNQNKD